MAAAESRSELGGSLTGKAPMYGPARWTNGTAETAARVEPAHKADERRWAELMAKSQAGEEAAYRRLLLELTDVIYGFLCNRFGKGHFIEDCVQETLLAIHEARHTYDPRRPFRPWLFAIVRHKAIDNLRKRRARNTATSHYRDTQEVLSQVNPVNEAEMDTIKTGLLDRLSATHREVIVLTKFIGFSVAETAARLGISESLVKVRVHRAIHKLKLELEAEVL